MATGCKGDELSGAFVIGKGGDFPTFAAALAALEKGVCADVTFTVQGGTYAETGGFLFKPVPGAGPTANQGGIATRNGAHKGLRIVGNHFEGIVGMPSIQQGPAHRRCLGRHGR